MCDVPLLNSLCIYVTLFIILNDAIFSQEINYYYSFLVAWNYSSNLEGISNQVVNYLTYDYCDLMFKLKSLLHFIVQCYNTLSYICSPASCWITAFCEISHYQFCEISHYQSRNDDDLVTYAFRFPLINYFIVWGQNITSFIRLST
jgi:hypothetical protein